MYQKVLTLLGAATLATTLVGCGGGSGDSSASLSSPTAGGPTNSAHQEPAGTGAASALSQAAVSHSVGKTVNFGAWKITVKSLRYEPGSSTGAKPTVMLELTAANQSHRIAAPDLALDLANGDHHWRTTGNDSMPTVPGQAQNAMKASFTVDENFAADTAVLTVGSADQVQSVMPLGAGGKLVANTPQELTVDQSCTSGSVTQHITGGRLLTGLPEIDKQADRDKRFLILDIDVTNNSKKPTPYGDLVAGDVSSYELKEPSGNSVTLYNLADSYGDMPVVTVRPGKTGHTKQLYTIDVPTSVGYEWSYTFASDSGEKAAPGACPVTLP